MNIILGLDAGTHGVRALAYAPEQRRFLAAAGHDYPRHSAAGIQEMSPTVLLETFRGTLADILQQVPQNVHVEALGITHQRGTVIPVDAGGVPLAAALCDSDSALWGWTQRITIGGLDVPLSPSTAWPRSYGPDSTRRSCIKKLPHGFLLRIIWSVAW